jgi:hypothetical protein
MDREPSTILDAVDHDGAVQIKRRDGRIYSIRPESGTNDRITALPDLENRRKAIFRKTIPAAHVRRVDKLIGGE